MQRQIVHLVSMLLHSLARTYGEFENQLKLIPVMAFNTPGTATSMKSLFPPKSSPSSVQTRNLLPRLFRIISKSSTASPSPAPKPGGHGNVLSKSSTVRMKKLTTLSPSTVKKFNVQTQGVLCNSISTQRRIDLNVCSYALRPVQWALLIVALFLVLMERI